MRGVSCKNAFLGAVCVHIVVSFEAVFWHVTSLSIGRPDTQASMSPNVSPTKTLRDIPKNSCEGDHVHRSVLASKAFYLISAHTSLNPTVLERNNWFEFFFSEREYLLSTPQTTSRLMKLD